MTRGASGGTRRGSALARNLRRLSQALFAVAFLYLFLKTTYPLETRIPPDFFLRLSPLNGIITFITQGKLLIAFAPAVAVIAITLFFGRFFCGWLCPMGAVIDFTDRLFFYGRSSTAAPGLRRIKFALLALIALTAALGTPLLFAFDPIVIITRSFSLALFPPFYLLWQGAATKLPWMANILVTPTELVHFKESVVFFLLFAAILALGALQRRFWCRNLCPLGALLALIARTGLLVKRVSAACTDCLKCVRGCKMGAIPGEPGHFLRGECIHCYSCESMCPVGAISFRPAAPSLKSLPEERLPALNRRDVLLTLGTGVLWSVSGKTDFFRKVSFPGLIRPPGALPENEFLRTCIRCAGCMKVCVTNGLQPCLAEAGLEGIWTPRLVPRLGACEQMCDMCSKVCPTGAIQRYPLEEKEKIFIGQAFIDRSKCVAWNRGEECLVCDEVCSYKAIYWKSVQDIYDPAPNKKECGFCEIMGNLCPFHGEGHRPDTLKRPFVNERKCVGCGLCENKCPVNPDPAIVVTTVGEKRIARTR